MKISKSEESNKVVERVQVYCRLRPFTEEEYQKDRQSCIETFDPNNRVVVVKKEFEKKIFNFDSLLDPQMDQNGVYEVVGRNVVKGILNGYNGTIFAYGQTGTGKTYTMLGSPESERKKGIIPRSLEEIFNLIKNDKENVYQMKIGYIQIYMEMLQDLIEPSNTEIRIRESPENGVFLTGNAWIPVSSVRDCMKIINSAEKNRIVAFTNLNAVSSRSHAVFMAKLEKRPNYSIEQVENPEKIKNSSMVTSVLYLVDLAGSERVKKSKVSGDRLDEAISINSSLTSLGKCIHALTDAKNNYVPFRDSKLTRILQDSLGGNSKTALIVNIGPSSKNMEESLSSLYFGSRAMKVQNMPVMNIQKDYYALSVQLQSELDSKDDEISKMQIKLSTLMEEVTKMRGEYEKQQIQANSQEKLMKGLKSVYNTSNIKEIVDKMEKLKQEEINSMEERLNQIMVEKDEQHKEFLEEIDQLMLEQENEINELKNKNVEQAQQMKKMEEEYNELQDYFKEQMTEKDSEIGYILTEKDKIANAYETLQTEASESATKHEEQEKKMRESEFYYKKIMEELEDSKNALLTELQKELSQKEIAYEKLAQDFDNERRRLKEKNDHNETVIKSLEQRLRTLENSKEHEKQIEEYQYKLTECQNEIKELTSEKNEFTKKEKSLKKKIEDLEASIIKQGDDTKAIEESFAQKERKYMTEIDDLNRIVEEIGTSTSRENSKFREDNEKLNLQITSLNSEISNLTNTQEELQGEIKNLQETLASKEQELKDIRQILVDRENLHTQAQSELNGQIQNLKNQIDMRDASLTKSSEENNKKIYELKEEYEEKIKVLEKDKSELEITLNASQMDNESLLHKIEAMQVTKSPQNQNGDQNPFDDFFEQENTNTNHHQEIEDLKKQVQELEHKNQASQEENKKSLQEKIDEIEKLNEKIKDLESRLEDVFDLNKEVDNDESDDVLKQKINSLTEENMKLKQNITECNGKIQKLEEQIKELSESLDMKDELIQEKDKLIEELNTHIEEKSEQIDSLSSDLHDQKITLQNNITSLEEDNNLVLKKLNQVQGEKNELEKKFAEKEEQIRRLQEEIEDLQEAKEKLEKQISEQAENEEKNEKNINYEEIKEIEMNAELQSMENETLRLISEEVKEENEKLKADIKMLKKVLKEQQKKDPKGANLLEAHERVLEESLEESQDKTEKSLMNGQEDQSVTEQSSKILNSDSEDISSSKIDATNNSMTDKEQLILRELKTLESHLEDERNQKEILIEEKDTLTNKLKSLEKQVLELVAQVSHKDIENERLLAGIKRFEREKEETDIKVKELKKVIETNQNNFANQTKNQQASSVQHEKEIKNLKQQISQLMDDKENMENDIDQSNLKHQKALSIKQNEINNLNLEIKEALDNLQKKSKRIRELEESLKQLKAQYESLEFEKNSINQKLEQEYMIQNERKSIASVQSESDTHFEEELREATTQIEILREKAQKLEQDFKSTNTANTKLRIQLESVQNQYNQELCETLLDKMVLQIELEQAEETLKENKIDSSRSSAKSHREKYDLEGANPSKSWFQYIAKSHKEKNGDFSLDKFYHFVNNFRMNYSESAHVFKLYDWSFQSWKQSEKPVIFSALKQNENLPLNDDTHDVYSVLDNMILILEIESEMEAKVNLDLTALKVENQLESTFNSIANTTTPRHTFNELNGEIPTPRNVTNFSKVQSSDIFIKKYNNKLKAIKHALNPIERITMNSISCDSKILEQLANMNIQGNQNSVWNKSLMTELTNLFTNTYNYCIYLYQQCDFKDLVAKDLQSIIEICVSYLARQQLDFKILKKQYKVLWKKYNKAIRELDKRSQNFQKYTNLIQEKSKYEKAALMIQRFYRRRKQSQIEKAAFRTNFMLARERKNSEQMARDFGKFNAGTGKYIINQSMNHFETVFANLSEIFIQKSTVRYKKFKQLVNKK